MSALVGQSHLRVSYVWHDEVMADEVLREPASVTLGAAAGVTFVVPPLGLPEGFEIVRPGARGYLLTLGEGMTGRLRLGGVELDVADFVRRGGGGPEGSQGDYRASGIEPGDWGVVHLDGEGKHSLFFQFVKAEAPLPPGKMRDADLLAFGFAFAFVLAAAVMVAIHLIPIEKPPIPFGSSSMIANYLVNRPAPEPPPSPQPRAGEEDSKEVTPPKSTQGKEGKAGGEGEKERQRAPDPDKGEPDQTMPEEIQVGLNSRASREAIKKTLDRGGFDEKLGKAIARMQGPLNDGTMGGSGRGKGLGFGAGEGTGTSTRGGTGSGGGGKNIGDVQTYGRIDTGGERAARGTPGGKGVKEVAVKVDVGEAASDFGGLTKAEIEKVVRSRRNGFNTCYIRELQRSKGLGGKIVMAWKIDAAGGVKDARVVKSDMSNGRVEDCLVRQVASLRFPPSRNGSSTRVTGYPIVFAER